MNGNDSKNEYAVSINHLRQPFSIKQISIDNHNNVWFATHAYIFRLNQDSNTLDTILSGRSYEIDSENNKTWMATTGGIHIWKNDTLKILPHIDKEIARNTLCILPLTPDITADRFFLDFLNYSPHHYL